MDKEFKVVHVALEMQLPFDDFTSRLEAAAGKFYAVVLEDLTMTSAEVKTKIDGMAGKEGLMIFGILDHGRTLELFGIRQKAKQYEIGNPLVAASMTKYDVRAALYAPLRVLVYVSTDGVTVVAYDLPSSLFGALGNSDITAVGISLDNKLKNLLAIADNPAISLQ